MRLATTDLRRGLTVALPCLAVVLVAAAIGWWCRAPLSAIATRNIALERLERDAHRWATESRPGDVRGVVFGDSLMLSLGWLEYGRNQPGVGVLLRKALRADGVQLDLLILAHPSFRPVHLAYFLDEVLAGRPRFLVMDLNLRLLASTWTPEPGMRFEHLSRRLSPARQIALRPWLHGEGLGLFDPTVFRVQDALSLLYVTDGARIAVKDWLDARATGVEKRLGLTRDVAPARTDDEDLGLYWSDVAGSPSVTLLRELDRELAAAGVWTLYYVSPLNPDILAKPGMPSADEIARRIAGLRDALGLPEDRWLDLHAALPGADFLDRHNHLRPDGLRAVADRVLSRLRPVVEQDQAAARRSAARAR